MINILADDGAFYEQLKKRKFPILIYGMTLDGITFGRYLLNQKCELLGFIDKNADQSNELGIPVMNIENVDVNQEYFILLAAKTEAVAKDMISELKKNHINGTIFTWRSFCINKKNLGSEEFCNIIEFTKSRPWMYNSIYGDKLSAEYIEQVHLPKAGIVLKKENYFCYQECQSKYWNIDSNGRRFTVKQPKCDKTIHFFGDSRILGIGVEDGQTIPSCLQQLINEHLDSTYKVENYGITLTGIDNLYVWMQNTDIKKGDVVCFSAKNFIIDKNKKELIGGIDTTEYYKWYLGKIFAFCKEKEVPCFYFMTGAIKEVDENTLAEQTIISMVKILANNRLFVPYDLNELIIWSYRYSEGIYDLRSVINQNHLKMNFFVDNGHFSPDGCRVLAEKIFDIIFGKVVDYKNQEERFNLLNNYLNTIRMRREYYSFMWNQDWYLYEEYLREFRQDNAKKIGAIVMNANPFTKGHKYLVEWASKKVDVLYVFVLEEEKSYFSFENRFNMVRLGTSEYKNVFVLKSGKFIISLETFPEYFEINPENVNCSKDLKIFARIIAPILNIQYRFVGQEPYSGVTRTYNEQMKVILPEYGIECVEIERLAIDENIISATKVRQALLDKNLDVLKDLLPETTFKYLRQKLNLIKE